MVRIGQTSVRMSTLARCAVSPSLSAMRCTSSAIVCSASRLNVNHAAAAQKVVRRQPLAKRAVPPVGKHVRRAGGVVAQGHRAVVAQERRAGVRNLRAAAARRCRWRCASAPARSGRQCGRLRRRRAPGSARRTPPGSARASSPRDELGQLPLPARRDVASSSRSLQVIRMLAPGACSAWAIRSAAAKSGRVDVVGDHDHFARAGDRIDIDFAIDVLLGQRDEQVAGADDLIDLRHALDAVGQRRHGLRAADAIDLA